MYCSNCGAEASGNFCSRCGAPLSGVPAARVAEPAVPDDWSREIRYETLMRVPEVRDLIGRQGSRAQRRLSGEELLSLFNQVTPIGVSVEKLGAALLPIFTRLGIKTGKEQSDCTSAFASRVPKPAWTRR